MLNIPELESRWKQYKIKSYTSKIIIFFVLILLMISGVYFYFNPIDTSNTNKIEKPKLVVKEEQIKKSKSLNIEKEKPTKHIAPPKAETKKITLEPSLGFIENIKESSPRYYNNLQSEKQDKAKQQKRKVIQKKERKKEVKKIKPQKASNNSNTLTINRQNTQNDINEVLRRFKKSNNPALSLFAAKKYYELGEYKQAYNYALITNGIDSNIEDSWIIFAKSAYKMGKKKKAISVLRKYISRSNSNRAKTLLKNLKYGKI